MSLQRQLTFWVAAIVVFALLLYIFRPILLPFVAGLAIAYFLDPIADWMQRHGCPRLLATALILGLFALILVLALIVIAPVLGGQIGSFVSALPGYIGSLASFLERNMPDTLKQLLTSSEPNFQGSLTDLAREAVSWTATLAASLWTGGLALVNLVSLLIVTPVVAFYLLYDWDRMVAFVDSWLPRDHADTIRGLGREIDEALAGFVRGQGTVCLILGVFYAVALSLAGLNFGLLIGLSAGLISFIPYVGSIVGFVVSGGVATVQFWPEWQMIALVLGIFIFGQALEGNFLSPKLVGDRVRLHPVWLMFALFAFGYLFGFVGLLVAVPVAAAIGVLVRFGLRRYLESPLYLGSRARVAGTSENREDGT